MNVLFSFTDQFALFLSAWIIFSLWAGYTIGITWMIPLATIIFVFCLHHFKKKWVDGNSAAITFDFSPHSFHAMILLTLFLVATLGYVFFGVQGGYDLSADATPSAAGKLIQTTIPATYAPYFDVPFFYQPGVPLLISQLHQVTGLPFHAGGWLLGVLGIILLVYAITRLAIWTSGKKEALFFAAALLIGARLIFVDLFVGEYPLLLGLGLSFTAILSLRDRPVMSAILFAGAGITHPYVAGILFGFALFLHRPTITTILRVSIIGFVAVLPLLVFMFLPALLSGGSTPLEHSLSVESFLRTILPLVVFLGVVPIVSILVLGMRMPAAFRGNLFLPRAGILAALGVLLYVILANFFPVLLLHSKFLEAGALFTIIFAAAALSRATPARIIVFVLLAVLLIGFFINFTSNDLTRLAHGSKTGIREAAFSEWFSRVEPLPERTIFFARGPGKMAQYSNKIPVDATSANFTLALHLFSRNPAAQYYLSETTIVREAVEKGCFSCVEKIPYHYLVVDTRLYALPNGMTPDYWHDDFAVFIKR